LARKHIEDDDEGILVEEPEEDEDWRDEDEERKDKATRDWDEEAEEGGEEGEAGEEGSPGLGRVYLRTDRGGSTEADIAARLQSPQSLTEQDLKWNSGYRDPGWDPPKRPIQQIIKMLGKRRLAEMEEKDRQAVAEAAARKEQAKQKAKVNQVKQRAKKRGQELLFDIELPPPEVQLQAAAAIAGVEVEPATNGHVNGNSHNGNGNGHTPGAAGDWTTFVERAKGQAGKLSDEDKAKLEKAVEQMAENLTQETMF